MARAKWNPKTGRFETSSGVDNPPNGFAPAGTQYVDAVTGQTKIANAGGPDIVVGNASPTTQPKATKTTQTPKASTTTTTPKATTTTMAPKAGATKTTQPAKPTSTPSRGGQGGVAPTAQQIQGLRTGPTPDTAVNEALNPPTDPMDAVTAFLKAQAAISASGGSGTKTPTPAELAAKYQAGINAANIQAKAGATAQTDYNKIGQTAYDTAIAAATPMYAGQIGDVNKYYDAQTGTTNTNYDNQLAAIKKYYDDQNTTASKTISDAGAAFLAGLPDATAFANAQVANLPQIQQGLGDALAAYGATGNKAQEVSTQDAAYLDAIAKMQTSANAQLSAADKAYMASLKTAGQGDNTAAQQALAGNLAGLRAQDISGINAARRGDLSAIDTARRGEIGDIQNRQFAATGDAEALRQQYIAKGIDALMSGKQTAAQTKAETAANYGVPKKAKKTPAKNLPKKTTKK